MKKKCYGNGFTLLEVVMVLVLVSIAAAMLVPYMRGGLDHSAQSMQWLSRSLNLSSQMAQIVARNTNDLETLRLALVSEGINAEYITFPEAPPYNPVSGGNSLLRVTIVDNENRRLVTLLGRPR